MSAMCGVTSQESGEDHECVCTQLKGHGERAWGGPVHYCSICNGSWTEYASVARQRKRLALRYELEQALGDYDISISGYDMLIAAIETHTHYK